MCCSISHSEMAIGTGCAPPPYSTAGSQPWVRMVLTWLRPMALRRSAFSRVTSMALPRRTVRVVWECGLVRLEQLADGLAAVDAVDGARQQRRDRTHLQPLDLLVVQRNGVG